MYLTIIQMSQNTQLLDLRECTEVVTLQESSWGCCLCSVTVLNRILTSACLTLIDILYILFFPIH